MAETMIEYSKSPTPPAKPGGVAVARDSDRAIGVNDRGQMTYASAAASGHVEVEIPSLPGSPNAVERLHARDFGPHVMGKIESAMRRQGYMKSGPQQDAAATLAHYLATARGTKLLDQSTLDYGERLVKEFAAQKADSRRTYFDTMVRPFLNGLTPQRRK